MKNIFTRNISRNKSILICFFIPFIYVYPIINSGIYYVDDIARSQTGYLGWDRLGRPLSDFIFFILTFGGDGSVDVSPLPQLLSIIIMGVTIHYISKKLFRDMCIASIIGASTVFLTPLFLQNIIYRYDSLSMVLSLSSCIFAGLYTSKNNYIEFITKSLFIIISLSLYQVSAVSFAMIILIKYAFYCMKGDDIKITKIIKELFPIAISYIVYLSVMALRLQTERSETIFNDVNWMSVATSNVIKILNLYLSSYTKNILIFIFSFALLSVLVYTSNVYKKFMKFKKLTTKVISIALILLPVILPFASMSTIIILKDALAQPRIATPFGIVILYIAFIIYYQSKIVSTVFSFVICSYAIITSFALSAAVSDQYSRDILLINEIKSVITNNVNLRNSKTTAFGIANESHVARINTRYFPVIRMINSRVYDGTATVMLTRYGLEGVNFSFNRSEWMRKALDVCGKKRAITSNHEFSIYNYENQNYVFLGLPASTCK